MQFLHLSVKSQIISERFTPSSLQRDEEVDLTQRVEKTFDFVTFA